MNSAQRFAEALPDLAWLDSDEIGLRQTSYWDASSLKGQALARPASTEQVSDLMRMASSSGQTIVTHGGRTTCVDGVQARSDDIILSLERMNRILEIDPVEGIAVVEAGVVLQTLQEAVADEGMFLPLDLGARGTCTIGGNVATNAGGVNVLRYGMMRNLVLGLEAVLPTGEVISSMNRMLKNNSGYDLKQLFIGTEGTLGVVTKVVVRLEPSIASRDVAMVALGSFDAVLKLQSDAKRVLAADMLSFEVMWGAYYDAVTGDGGHRAPLARGAPFYVLIEAVTDDSSDNSNSLVSFLESCFEAGTLSDGAVAASERERAEFWKVRDDFERILADPPVYLYDVSLPLRSMDAYIRDLEDAFGKDFPQGVLHVFGHLCDGNLHLFLTPRSASESTHEIRRLADESVYQTLARHHGAVSAEHGIGREKKDWLHISRSSEEIALMRKLKRTLDPANILNRGLVFDV
ncbi:FAD-binding oxidoreductase [Erythrobacter sp.]|uniref:FAD-binding oxidoreductase n=1 Tax=Erythrobacter sp. TaxID=1042 RepID=UPI00311E789C